MLSQTLRLLQLPLAGLSPALDPSDVGGCGEAEKCTSPLGFGHQPWLCQSGHPVRRQNGDCCGQEAWKDSGDILLQLESPRVLVISAQCIDECSVVQ